LLVVVAAACGSTKPAPPALPSGGTAGATCFAPTDCTSGACEGMGCDEAHPGRCVDRARACTMDVALYCGCDGKTFTSSGSCPGRRFSTPGGCR
jgi:hypothetical protein